MTLTTIFLHLCSKSVKVICANSLFDVIWTQTFNAFSEWKLWTGPKRCLLLTLTNEIHFLLNITTNEFTYSSTTRIALLKWNYFKPIGKKSDVAGFQRRKCTTSGLDLPPLCRLSYKVAQRELTELSLWRQHSYVPLLSLRRDSPSKIVPDFLCATL